MHGYITGASVAFFFTYVYSYVTYDPMWSTTPRCIGIVAPEDIISQSAKASISKSQNSKTPQTHLWTFMPNISLYRAGRANSFGFEGKAFFL
jgi:hypothetical protein